MSTNRGATEEMEAVEDIVIAGAGLAGLATALGLHRQATAHRFLLICSTIQLIIYPIGLRLVAHRKGARSLVLESSPVLRASGFAFTTWTNAFRALDALGVGDKIREHHLLYERMITFSAATGEPAAKVLIGCDGVNSVVAKWLGLPKPILSGRSATRGLAEYPAGHGFGPEILQFIGQGFRSGVLPCNDTSVYWNYTWYPSPADGDAEESVAKMRSYVLDKLRAAKIPAAALGAIEQSEMSDVVSSPLRFRSPLSLVRGSISKGGVCVAGDALHPMTPELGQGGSSALEDGVVLARCLGEAFAAGGGDEGRLRAALGRYAEERRWRSIKLITAAYVVGFIQQSNNVVVKFLRDTFLSPLLAKTLVAMADFDCGTL
nr:unnamed protein product [Digitaria exilis]